MIRETCPCGASTEVHSPHRDPARAAEIEREEVAAWRAEHRDHTGHERQWISETTCSDTNHQLVCTGCGQTRTEPRTTEVTGE